MKRILAALIMTMITSPVWAFGAAGHHAVCEITYQELTDATRAKVDAILKADPDVRFHSFGAACGWPDRHDLVPTILKKYGDDHFINVPRGAKDVRKCTKKGQKTDRCLITFIKKMERILKGLDGDKLGDRDNGYPKNKTEALRFLGHWLGDIHQPLHVSYGDDRGGNDIPVYGVKGCTSKPDKKDFDKDDDKTERVTKLHTVWDTCIVHYSMSERGFKIKTNSRTPFSKALYVEISDSQRSIWLSPMSLKKWAYKIANESYALAQGGLVGYCINKNNSCWYSENNKKFKKSDGYRFLSESESYEDLHRSTIEMRIKQAGVRLGALLNKLF